MVVADPVLAPALAGPLGAAMEVTCADNLPRAIDLAEDNDAILVDEGIAGDGESPCRVLREAGIALPLLLLKSGDGGDPDADAVLAKPVRLAAVTARLADMLARPSAPVVAIGDWRLDPVRRLLGDSGGRSVRLTDKEVAILTRLDRAAGAVVGRDDLLAEVWGYSPAITTHTLETHIYRLRRKMADSLGSSAPLLTESGGYRLVARS